MLITLHYYINLDFVPYWVAGARLELTTFGL